MIPSLEVIPVFIALELFEFNALSASFACAFGEVTIILRGILTITHFPISMSGVVVNGGKTQHPDEHFEG